VYACITRGAVCGVVGGTVACATVLGVFFRFSVACLCGRGRVVVV
jgi:hypothetical protein